MLFDTDVLIWYFRGNPRAAEVFEKASERSVSVVTCMELLQGAKNKNEIRLIRSFLKDFNFAVLPLTENIGYRALIYMEEYCLKIRMCMADALLAASAVEYNLPLCTGNQKHYRLVGELDIKLFKPD